ncbi:MAG: DNA-processing protein DprA [Bryobacterales bacterium]|nr:DNA-processing protein DprA [Bryobacteraceae bacterium]MDW8130783.1 DNA-processing protein DprA [Bryobacterales bacterium]
MIAGSRVTREEELYWLALRMTPGLGTRWMARLVEHFRTPRAVFTASRSELEALGLSGSVAQSLASGCAFEDAVIQQEKMLAAGVAAITLHDDRYPWRLREIFDPPVVLFVRGRAELLRSVMLAVVGTRRATPYGLAATERLAGDLARAGLVIVSGMARGIDTAAHKAALAAGAPTVAVLGCGADVVYPIENRRLAEQIAERGLLVSEFPMGTPAYPQNFPIRNRIISGLSAGVLVVEGAQYSGSAITARLALEQNREVFAVPGNITSRMSWGPNLLIKQGAKLVQDANDVLVELPLEDRRRLALETQGRLFAGQGSGGQSCQPGVALSETARRVLAHLHVDAGTHLDELLERCEDLSSSEIIAALFELEMAGLIRQLPGKNFVKVWGESRSS